MIGPIIFQGAPGDQPQHEFCCLASIFQRAAEPKSTSVSTRNWRLITANSAQRFSTDSTIGASQRFYRGRDENSKSLFTGPRHAGGAGQVMKRIAIIALFDYSAALRKVRTVTPHGWALKEYEDALATTRHDWILYGRA